MQTTLTYMNYRIFLVAARLYIYNLRVSLRSKQNQLCGWVGLGVEWIGVECGS